MLSVSEWNEAKAGSPAVRRAVIPNPGGQVAEWALDYVRLY